jgi:hypothetical protein
MSGTKLGKGVIAGFVATVVLSVIMVAKSMTGLMPQLNVIAMLTTITGVSPAVGWVVHFQIGTILWGALFAWLDPYLPGARHWLKGVVFGIGAWLLMMVLFMPRAGAGFFGMSLGIVAPIVTLVLHVIYGAVLGGVFGAEKPEAVDVAAVL